MQKLELTWIGKGQEPTLEPRILLHDPEHSIGIQSVGSTAGSAAGNMLIHGDNLLALKALEQDFSGKVKCIYIDPPFNTGQAFEHYDDGIEHSLWLSLMANRLKELKKLLSYDGSIWVHCDDNEQAYLKAVMDEIFGRVNFITTFIWQKVDSPNDNKVPITPDHDYILCYSRNPKETSFKPKFDESLLNAYRFDEETGKLYRDRLLKKNGKNSLRTDRPSMFFPVLDPDGNEVYPIHDNGQEACWSYGKEGVEKMLANNEIIWKRRTVNNKEQWVPYTREYPPDSPTRPYPTIWTDVMTTRQAKAHQRLLFPDGIPFETPKPESLIERIFSIATNPGDLVLDSFLGSGTTAAVAHKMGRRWIGIELGAHAYTHCYERLRKVVRGEDAGGITEATGWKGGGGFRFYTLAPSLLCKDKYGQWVIDERYNAAMLAAAMAKQEGFRYEPHETTYWKQGRSTEKDFIYTTTQFITVEALERLRGEMKDDESLLVCCRSYDSACKGKHPNITIKKIPLMLLGRCEFGKDDYSLNVETTIVNLPQDGDDEDLPEASTEASSTPTAPKKRGAKKASTDAATQNTFFE